MIGFLLTLIATIGTNEYHAGFVEIRVIRDRVFRTLIATIGTNEYHTGFVEIREIRDWIFRTLIATIGRKIYAVGIAYRWWWKEIIQKSMPPIMPFKNSFDIFECKVTDFL